MALLVAVTILWATEAIPLWVTSLSIPLVVIISRILLTANNHHQSAAGVLRCVYLNALTSLTSAVH